MPDGGALPFTPRVLRIEHAALYVGLSTTTFRQVVVPDVPAVRLTAGRVAWLREDLDAWIDQRKANPSVDGPKPGGDAPPVGGASPKPEVTHGRDPIAGAFAHLEATRRSRRKDAAR